MTLGYCAKNDNIKNSIISEKNKRLALFVLEVVKYHHQSSSSS